MEPRAVSNACMNTIANRTKGIDSYVSGHEVFLNAALGRSCGFEALWYPDKCYLVYDYTGSSCCQLSRFLDHHLPHSHIFRLPLSPFSNGYRLTSTLIFATLLFCFIQSIIGWKDLLMHYFSTNDMLYSASLQSERFLMNYDRTVYERHCEA